MSSEGPAAAAATEVATASAAPQGAGLNCLDGTFRVLSSERVVGDFPTSVREGWTVTFDDGKYTVASDGAAVEMESIVGIGELRLYGTLTGDYYQPNSSKQQETISFAPFPEIEGTLKDLSPDGTLAESDPNLILPLTQSLGLSDDAKVTCRGDRLTLTDSGGSTELQM